MPMTPLVHTHVKKALKECREADACWAMNRCDDAWAHSQEATRALMAALAADRRAE